jgi:hypothetical protein
VVPVEAAAVHILTVLGLLLLLMAGCGIKTPVIAPDLDLPQAVSGFELFVHGGQLLFTWAAPSEKRRAEVAGYKIFFEDSWAVERSGCRCRKFEELAFLDLAQEEEKWRDNKKVVLRLPVAPQWNGKVLNYVVVPVGRKGYAGAESREISIYWTKTPLPPGGIEAEPGDRSVQLEWAPPEQEETGFNIYRRAEGTQYPLHPINQAPVRENRYLDRSVQNQETYFYMIRTVGSLTTPWIESRGSEEVAVVPEDRSAPAPPSRVEGIAGAGMIRLLWDENQEADLAGYRIYRRGDGRGKAVRVGEVTKPVTVFTDSDIAPGQTYEYYVTAFDNAAGQNESQPSKRVKISTR